MLAFCRSLASTGSGPQVMAARRTIAIFPFKRSGFKSTAAAARHYICNPDRVLEVASMPN